MTKLKYNYSKLIKRIAEMFEDQYTFAEYIGINHSVLSLKLNSEEHFEQNEIKVISAALDIKSDDVAIYFFAC